MDYIIDLDDFSVEEIRQMVADNTIPADYPEWFYCNSKWDEGPDDSM